METLAYILKTLRKFILILILVWVVIFSVGLFFPELNIQTILSSNNSATTSKDWLPAPGSFKGLLGNGKVSSGYDNVYSGGNEYNGYGNSYNNNQGGSDVDYVTFTASGTQVIKGGSRATTSSTTTEQPTPQQPAQPSEAAIQRARYVRNLSIYEGGHIYTGISFVGEAQSTMFKDGKFPVVILDQKGKVVTVVPAEAATNWAIPGWIRFQTKINATLPNKTPCTMIFQSANGSATEKPLYVSMPILCN